MKYFLIFWLLPVGGLMGWLYLAQNDMSFGIHFLSRDMFDLVFGIYGNILGVDPETLPPLIWNAIIFDTFLVAAFVAFRKRKAIMAWFNARNLPQGATDQG